MALPIEEQRARLRERLRQALGSTGGWHPLSHTQEALWFLWRMAPQSGAYNLAIPVGIGGPLDVPRFQRCWHLLVARHPVLRTQFGEQEGEPRQRIQEVGSIDWSVIEAAEWTREQLEAALYDAVHAPINLETNAPPRLTLFRASATQHYLVVVVYHILADLWSLTLLMEELRVLYDAERTGGAAVLAPVPVTYEDYIRWHRKLIAGPTGERSRDYWHRQLAGELPILDLPVDRSRPAERSFRGSAVIHELDEELTEQLKKLAAETKTTLFTVLLSAYQVLLHRYTGQSDIIVGTPVLGRQRTELEGVVGDFVNILPLRADLSGHRTFTDLLAQMRLTVRGALEHQEYPFSLLVKELQRNPDLSRPPIFQTSFVLQKFHRFPELARTMLPAADEPPIEFSDLQIQPLPVIQQDGQFDLNLEMKENERGRLMAGWKYSSDLFERETVVRMAGQFTTLLREIAARPQGRMEDLPLLTAEESAAVIATGRGHHAELPGTNVVDLFEARAQRVPAATAVREGERTLSYGQLAERVTAYANGLAKLGVTRETLVGLMLPRGADFIAWMLGILKAGGAFLPMDPRQPLARTGKALLDGRVELVIATAEAASAVRGVLAELARGSTAPLVAEPGEIRSEAAWAPPPLHRQNLAYVMYTSGSTGHPKGAMVEHLGMVNHVLAKLTDLRVDARDVVAQTGPQSFDIVVWQCVAPLLVGAAVLVLPDEVAENPRALLLEMEKRSVTIVQLVPSMLAALLDEVRMLGPEAPALAALRWMVPTGDALPTTLAGRWLAAFPKIPLLNTYGSTECSDDQCHYVLHRLAPRDEAAPVSSIGAAIHNMQAHVLDRNLAPVAVGVVGELYIGGIGVGRGYRHDPAKTAVAFIPDPFSGRPGARLYRTADLVRRRTDGNIDFLGRTDQMIKLRGFRIEPREVEAALLADGSIAQAAVVARLDPAGERRLVAYMVPTPGSPDMSAKELRERLAGMLPQYMVPAIFCQLEALPMSSNGKLDRRRLPEPPWPAACTTEYVAPRTPEEAKLVHIWGEVLNLARVGVTDDFFAIGGDSIRSIQMVSRSRPAGFELEAADVFRHRTVAALCALRKAPVAAPSAKLPAVSADQLRLALTQVEFEDDDFVEETAPPPQP